MSCEAGREERVLEDLETTERSGEGEDGYNAGATKSKGEGKSRRDIQLSSN